MRLDAVPGALEAFLAEPVAADSMRRANLTHQDLTDAITAALADTELVAIPSRSATISLEEMNEDQWRILEMHLKRIAKLERKLANAMAKASETASSIIANVGLDE